MSRTESMTITEREGVKAVIRWQYQLHEIKHHEFESSQRCDLATVMPLAHTMADIYKCLHQGTFGYWKHIPGRKFFRNHLANDYFNVQAVSDAPVLESVTPDHSIVRVNLKPYKAAVNEYEKEAFFILEKVVLDSSLIEKGCIKEFFDTLHMFKELNLAGELTIENRSYVIPNDDVEYFLRECYEFKKTHGILPLLSHSKIYHRLNHPSYVIADLSVIKNSPLTFLLQDTAR